MLAVAAFGEFLLMEIGKHDWSQSKLASLAGVSRAAISDVISGRRNPGTDLCTSIAHALDLPPENVFRAAGLLPELPTFRQAVTEILTYKLNELNDRQLDELILLIDYIIQRDRNQDNSQLHGLHGK